MGEVYCKGCGLPQDICACASPKRCTGLPLRLVGVREECGAVGTHTAWCSRRK